MGLFLRNLLWTLLCPGTVTILLPCYLFDLHWETEPWQGHEWMGLALILPGAGILLHCIYAFAKDGKGTLSPADPARRLVVKGLYRYTRNPMYVGVMMVLLGEHIFFASMALMWYAVAVFLVFNLFIRFYEEPYLRRQFGAEYEAYCQKVGRWLPDLSRLFK